MSFEEQAKRAHRVEDNVAKSLLSMKPDYVRVHHDDRKQKGFDLEFIRPNRSNLKIEVKEDLMFSKTGNVAVETRSRGKDSGITTTESEWWVYVLGDEYYICPVQNLRYLCDRHSRSVVGGDDVVRWNGEVQKSSELKLIKVDVFKSICQKLPKYEDVVQDEFDKLHSVA